MNARWLIALPLAVLICLPLSAAEEPSLAQKQREVGRALSDLREILSKVAEQAAKEDPALEKKLRAACAVIDECDLEGDISELTEQIADMNFVDALIKGGNVQEDLDRLINCLCGVKVPSDKQIDIAKRLLEKINDLIQRQEKIDQQITKENVTGETSDKLAKEQNDAVTAAQGAAADAKQADLAEVEQGLEDTVAEMQSAAKAINDARPGAARYHSKIALQKLNRLRDILTDELPMMVLMRIEAWLQEMIKTQTGVLDGTIDCEQRYRKAGVVSRTLRGTVSTLQQDELRVASLAEEVIQRLRKEDNVLTCEILEGVKADAGEVADLLSRDNLKHPDLGPYCQFVQRRILADLKLLVEMVQEEQERRQWYALFKPAEKPYEPKNPPPNEKPASLLDPVAELVSLRLLQQNVIAQWDALQQELRGKTAPDEIDTLMKNSLANKQSYLRDIVKKLLESGAMPAR